MPVRSARIDRRGGVLLDGVVALGLILFAAFALAWLGFSFGEVVRGAAHFFGVG